MDLEIRRAAESDLLAVLRLYAQPGMDNGHVLTVDAAAKILRRDMRGDLWMMTPAGGWTCVAPGVRP